MRQLNPLSNTSNILSSKLCIQAQDEDEELLSFCLCNDDDARQTVPRAVGRRKLSEDRRHATGRERALRLHLVGGASDAIQEQARILKKKSKKIVSQ